MNWAVTSSISSGGHTAELTDLVLNTAYLEFRKLTVTKQVPEVILVCSYLEFHLHAIVWGKETSFFFFNVWNNFITSLRKVRSSKYT